MIPIDFGGLFWAGLILGALIAIVIIGLGAGIYFLFF